MGTIKSAAILIFVFFASWNAFAAKPMVEKPMAPPSKATEMFFKASLNANFEMMDTYLARGADINCGNCEGKGRPPLAMALGGYQINMDLVRYLVKHGANVNLLTQGALSPLMFAISSTRWSYFGGNPEDLVQAMTYLVDSGADVKLINSDGQNALFYLVAHGYDQRTVNTSLRLMRYLVDKGTDVNHQSVDGRTALMLAASGCGIDSVKLLLFMKADPKLKNKMGDTALSLAEDKAASSQSGGSCNQVVAMLRDPEQYRINPLSNSDIIGISGGARSGAQPGASVGEQQEVAFFAGKYSGTFNGSDEGTFQATILQDGAATSTGHSNKTGNSFTGEGKVSSDGSIMIGNISTGTTFTGTISRDGIFTGNWKNTTYNQAGSFQGSKGTQVANTQPPPPANPLQAIGGLLNGIGKILGAPQQQR